LKARPPPPPATLWPPSLPQAVEARLAEAKEAYASAVGPLEAACAELEAQVRRTVGGPGLGPRSEAEPRPGGLG
jgi:hypothetical protein